MGLVMATEIKEDGPHLRLERVPAFLQLQFSPFANLQIYPAPNSTIHVYFGLNSGFGHSWQKYVVICTGPTRVFLDG